VLNVSSSTTSVVWCFVVLHTMNLYYQHCLSACKQLRNSFSTSHADTCNIEVASISATRLLYHYAINTVCCLSTLLWHW